MGTKKMFDAIPEDVYMAVGDLARLRAASAILRDVEQNEHTTEARVLVQRAIADLEPKIRLIRSAAV